LNQETISSGFPAFDRISLSPTLEKSPNKKINPPGEQQPEQYQQGQQPGPGLIGRAIRRRRLSG
jgi:hypothetical protein